MALCRLDAIDGGRRGLQHTCILLSPGRLFIINALADNPSASVPPFILRVFLNVLLSLQSTSFTLLLPTVR